MKPETEQELIAFKEKGTPPGDFCYAVLSNNLIEAFRRADYENECSMKEIVSWCFNHLPGGSWGSPEKAAAWILNRGSMGWGYEQAS